MASASNQVRMSFAWGTGTRPSGLRYQESFKDFKTNSIRDVHHCRDNLWLFIESCFPDDHPQQWVKKKLDEFFEGRYNSFFNALNHAVRIAPSEEAKEAIRSKRKYFRRNKERIRYRNYLETGCPISTCFVESTHQHVIGIRVRKNGRTYRDDRHQMIADFCTEYKSNRLPYVFQRILEIQESTAV